MKALVLAELRQRIRGKRWWILLGLWVFVLWGIIALVQRGAVSQRRFDPDLEVGVVMFGSLVLFVLGLACLIVPALTSTSVNGERDRGTLAVLQATMLRPWEIVAAKFVAGLIIASGFLTATVPIAIWSATEGGVRFGRALIVYLILVLMCALFLLIALAASAVVRKPALSAVAAYGIIFFLVIGTPILYGVSLLSAPQENFEREVGWRWVILAPNPFVVLADAAPRSGSAIFSDPLQGIRDSVRESRRAPGARFYNEVEPIQIDPETGEPMFPGEELLEPEPLEEPPALWPAGAAIDLLIAGLAALSTRERLRVPAARLAVGERIA